MMSLDALSTELVIQPFTFLLNVGQQLVKRVMINIPRPEIAQEMLGE